MAQRGQVRTAVALRDVVGEALHAFLIAVVPLHRAFHAHAVFFAERVEDFFVQRRFFAVHVLHEAGHAAGKGEAFVFAVALVNQFDVHAVVQEGKFADAFGENVEAVFDVAEGFRAGEEAHGRTFFVGIADNP